MRSRNRVIIGAILACLLLQFGQANPAFATSQRSLATAYADKWTANPPATKYNSYYNHYSNDCTNYVSQALISAQWPRLGPSDGQPYYWYPYTRSFTVVADFVQAWQGDGRAYSLASQTKSAAYTSASVGDVYVYDWGKGDGISHLSIEIGWATGGRASMYSADGQGDYMDQHTTDRLHAPWNYGYLHPTSSINTSTMKIYVLPLKYDAS